MVGYDVFMLISNVLSTVVYVQLSLSCYFVDDPACSDLMDKVRLRSVSLTETGKNCLLSVEIVQ